MKQLLIQIDDELARRLDERLPPRSRRRSEFVRAAIRRALWDADEQATARAYALQPDSASEAHVDARVWEGTSPRKAKPRRKR